MMMLYALERLINVLDELSAIDSENVICQKACNSTKGFSAEFVSKDNKTKISLQIDTDDDEKDSVCSKKDKKDIEKIKKTIRQMAEEFNNYTRSLDGKIFRAACQKHKPGELKILNDFINSYSLNTDIEAMQKAIDKFKKYCNEAIMDEVIKLKSQMATTGVDNDIDKSECKQ